MAETFVVGDTVQLKSGGPIMTVEDLDENSVDCVWFNGKTEKRNNFITATLKKVNASASIGVVGIHR